MINYNAILWQLPKRTEKIETKKKQERIILHTHNTCMVTGKKKAQIPFTAVWLKVIMHLA